MKLLEEYCNDDQGLTMDRIIQYLENESGQTFERKAIYRDIDVINEITDLQVNRKAGLKAYRVKKENALTKEEIEIITNSLLTAKFISQEDTKEIIRKLHQLAGLSRDKSITKIRLQDRIKNQNSHVIKNIEMIREAIRNNRKIQFDYVKYDIHKEMHTEKEKCIISPYENAWYQDFYYLLGCFAENKISHYRVDRIMNLKILEIERKSMSEIMGRGKEFNIAEYMSKLVGMSSGYEENVVIKFKNEYLGEVIDTLGDKVSIGEAGPDDFLLRARIMINKKFYRWVLGFGAGAVIEKPDTVKQEIFHRIRQQVDNYKELS